MRIVFLGTGEIGVPSLRALASGQEHQVLAVYTQPDKPGGRDLKLRPTPIKAEAQKLGLPVSQPEKIRLPAVVEELRALQPDVIVVVAYGQILPKSILEIPRLACLNIHASLLPRHRGASPINAAILSGDAQSGITVMYMDVGLDTGDILLMAPTPLGRHETAGALHDRLAGLAPGVLTLALALLERGEAPRVPQDNSLATYASKMSRADGLIDWSLEAVEIGRRVRGMVPWPGAYTNIVEEGAPPSLLKVHAALICRRCSGEVGRILRADSRGILVGAGAGAVLLREVQAAGGRRMKAAEFLRGRALSPGTLLQ
ncbi:methionyl-tRNA formyltransferase [soil metagenome]